jgi:hypothetical protein
LDNITFDKLSELLAIHDKTFGKKQQSGEDVLVASTSKSTTEKGVSSTKGNEHKANEHQYNTSQYSNRGCGQG